MSASSSAPRILERFTWFEVEADEPEAEVNVLLKRLDKRWQALLEASGQRKQDLIEIFLQLGRRPKAIFDNGVSKEVVFLTDGAFCERVHIDKFVESLGWQERFKSARIKSACFPTTLHRISLITKGSGNDVSVIGLNARIGRSLTGFAMQMCPWLVNSKSLTVAPGRPPATLTGKSVLLIGRPGAGKTTLLREMARALSRTDRTVVVVDKINEIAGDFEVPHACIGEARWLPCGNPELHPQIMREAVEYNAPDVVLVDEICNAAEVEAACKIAERGVSIIATVHGNTLADILNCPMRQVLLGSLQQVSSDTATPRQQKSSPLKRATVPAFDVIVELHQKDRWILHPNVRYAVDSYLRGETLEAVELRPGMAIATLGYVVDDGLSYGYGSLNFAARPPNDGQSTPRVLGRVNGGASPQVETQERTQQNGYSQPLFQESPSYRLSPSTEESASPSSRSPPPTKQKPRSASPRIVGPNVNYMDVAYPPKRRL